MKPLANTNDKEVSILNKGMSFGEQALLNDAPRAATIRCNEDCYFAVLSKEDY